LKAVLHPGTVFTTNFISKFSNVAQHGPSHPAAAGTTLKQNDPGVTFVHMKLYGDQSHGWAGQLPRGKAPSAARMAAASRAKASDFKFLNMSILHSDPLPALSPFKNHVGALNVQNY
jgi:hypothetical protein